MPDYGTIKIQELPNSERPRERLQYLGAKALSDGELLALQIASGSQRRSALGIGDLLLAHFKGLEGVALASVEQLMEVPGIGIANATKLSAAVEIGRRLAAKLPEDKPKIQSPEDASRLLMPDLRDAQKEHFRAIMLDSKNRVLKIATISIGTLDSSLVHPREVFKEAIAVSAAGIIVGHNHPSGDPTPSAEDRHVTERLIEAGKLLGIEVLDHIVVGNNRYVSFKERGFI